MSHAPRNRAGPEPLGLLEVTIDDARSSGFGMSKHTTYRISCTPLGPIAGVLNQPALISRLRFSEFVTLHAKLLEVLPGVELPALPDKDALNRFCPDVIESRRSLLQIFLQAAVDDPDLCFRTSCLAELLRWPAEFSKAVRASRARRLARRILVRPPERCLELRDDARRLHRRAQQRAQRVELGARVGARLAARGGARVAQHAQRGRGQLLVQRRARPARRLAFTGITRDLFRDLGASPGARDSRVIWVRTGGGREIAV